MKKSQLLCLLLAVTLSGVSCGGGDVPSDGTTASGSDNTAAPEEITRENYPDSLGNVRFDGRAITIAYTAGDDTINYEIVGDDTGDIVSDAIYARSSYVEERLGVKKEKSDRFRSS